MKFYDREKEIEILRRNWEKSAEHSLFTVMIGRRRIGKTALLLKTEQEQKMLYLYVSKDNERVLVEKFQKAAEEVLGLHIYGRLETFAQFFEQIMKYGKEHHFTIVFDEFQNFLKVNPAIPSHIQDIWDRYHESTMVNLVTCGSIYSMMHKIFDNDDEPLYGRKDCEIRLKPFRISVIKEILHDYNPNYTAEDLLCLYMLTGGVAKYIALLMDAGATDKESMLKWATALESPFITEGRELVLSEFGKDYANYLSILQLVAGGMTVQNQIDNIIGKNTGTYLKRLEEDYNYVSKLVPMFSKPGCRNLRWSVEDCFLRFWFRFVLPNQSLIETERNDLLLEIVERDYNDYTGLVLEQYFRQKIGEEERVTLVGNYWDRKGMNEIDLIALNDIDKTALVAEVKRNADRYNPKLLQEKFDSIRSNFGKYGEVQLKGLSMQDM
ncbi:ATP-binding protein [uncultured Prevotella sp.]|uniref:ATP-binding protein n=1 Tax=uncultured Prevotella sp. TaxID=159272 RepID=UPI00260EAE1A|nr:ATP-binding protein [uncultured Prevotella sp.]